MTGDVTTSDGASPVSFPIRARAIPKAGTPVEFNADAKQRESLAARHGLPEVKSFSVSLLATRWKKDSVRLKGRVHAAIAQHCVVTLEAIEAALDEDIDLVLVPERSRLDPLLEPGGELILDPVGKDEPEVFSGDTIDAGAIAEEFFSLAIDPYPRTDGAKLDETGLNQDDEERKHPFAGLAALKSRH